MEFCLTNVTLSNVGFAFHASQGRRSEVTLKNHFHQGDCGALNIYILNPQAPSVGYVVGWAPLATGCAASPSYDGVVLSYKVLPQKHAESEAVFTQGETACHEAGHWANLEHFTDCQETHETVCSENNADNFMSCAPDVCRNHFNRQQMEIMEDALCLHRDLCRPKALQG